MMDLLQALLNDKRADLMEPLFEQAGFTRAQARSFLSPALAEIVEGLRRAEVPIEAMLAEGDLSALIGRIDVTSVANQAGVLDRLARSGLRAILPEVLSFLRERAGGRD